MKERPFNNVYFTGIIRDSQGRKMSKSLGNSPDPLDLIDKYGADGLRFGLMLIAPKGQDILFSEDRIEVGRNFMNKLWNASRFVMMNLASISPNLLHSGKKAEEITELSLADKWILNRLQHTIKEINKALDTYQFDTAARAIYQFVWGEFCDLYLEFSKSQIPNPKSKAILLHVLDNILRMLHPYAPFITEEIWQMLKHNEGSIVFAEYPKTPKKIEYEKEAKETQQIMDIISAIRNIRGEHNVSPAKQIPVTLKLHSKESEKIIEHGRKYITDLCRLSNLTITLDQATPKSCATSVAGKVDIFIPLAGMIDLEDERARLNKEIQRVEKYMLSLEGKLSNKNFVERAPKEVVAKERAQLEDSKKECEKFKHALKELDNL